MFRTGFAAFRNHQINCLRTNKLNIGTCGIEMRVVRNDVSFLASHSEENAFSCAALMSGNHMTITEDFLNGCAEALETLAAGIALVPFHHRRPLMRGHRTSAGISQ